MKNGKPIPPETLALLNALEEGKSLQVQALKLQRPDLFRETSQEAPPSSKEVPLEIQAALDLLKQPNAMKEEGFLDALKTYADYLIEKRDE
jgi:hypothetical protein